MNYNAIVVVNAKNASFNAGFDGLPRRLPNGKIYATDKAFKYCIRQYLVKNNKIFVERTQELQGKSGEEKLRYMTLKENYLAKTRRKELPKSEGEIIQDLLSFLDIRLFGVVFAIDDKTNKQEKDGEVVDEKKKKSGRNISFTGPCQISYGLNQFEGSAIYTDDILSPYRNPNPKSADSQHTTMGEQSRADDVYYVYDVSLNMNSAQKQKITLTNDDISKLKNALKYSVNEITSCTKFGCEVVSMIWFENKDDKVLNNLNALVNIVKDGGKTIVDYTTVIEWIEKDINPVSIEEYAYKVEHKGLPSKKK